MQIKNTILSIVVSAILVCSILGNDIMIVRAERKPTLESILNNADLTPMTLNPNRSTYLYRADNCILTGSWGSEMWDEDLNTYTNYILSVITTPEMSTYQKVKACYDWIIEHYNRGDWDECYGYMDCYGYTDAFVYLTRAIGLNSYFVHGETHMASGGYTNHGWAVIIIDGTEYVFDPEIDDNIAKGGKTGYYRFGKTYAEIPDKYIICDEDISLLFYYY